MKEKIQIAFVTVGILVVGMFLGFWLAWHRPLPHPAWIGGPGPRSGDNRPDNRPQFSPEQVDAFRKQIDLLQPALQDFQTRFSVLDADFHTKFDALLTDQQKALHPHHDMQGVDWVGDFTRMAEDHVGGPQGGQAGAPTPPIEGLPGLHPHQGKALMTLLRILMYEPTLRIVTDRYQLTSDQQTQLRALMEERRQALIALCRDHPLPLDQLYFSMRDLGLLPDSGGGHGEQAAGPGPDSVLPDHSTPPAPAPSAK